MRAALRAWLPCLLLGSIAVLLGLVLAERAAERRNAAIAVTGQRAELLLDVADASIDLLLTQAARLSGPGIGFTDADWAEKIGLARRLLPELTAAFRLDASGELRVAEPADSLFPGHPVPLEMGRLPRLTAVPRPEAGGRAALATHFADPPVRSVLLLFDVERVADRLAPPAAQIFRITDARGEVLLQRPAHSVGLAVQIGTSQLASRVRADGLSIEIGLTAPPAAPFAILAGGADRLLALALGLAVLGAAAGARRALGPRVMAVAHLPPPPAPALADTLLALEHSTQERKLLHAELHHRVKNNLQVVSSLLNLQIGRIQDRAARLAMQDALGRIQAISTVHELLYRAGEAVSIDVGDLLQTLARRIEQAFGGGRITCHVEAASLSVPVESAVKLALIANELLTNAFRHAFPGQRRGRIAISLIADDDQMRLRIADNGVGLPETSRATDGLGRQLTGMMAQYLGGQVTLKAGAPGTVAEIIVPLDRLSVG